MYKITTRMWKMRLSNEEFSFSRFLIEDAALYISDKKDKAIVDLKKSK